MPGKSKLELERENRALKESNHLLQMANESLSHYSDTLASNNQALVGLLEKVEERVSQTSGQGVANIYVCTGNYKLVPVVHIGRHTIPHQG